MNVPTTLSLRYHFLCTLFSLSAGRDHARVPEENALVGSGSVIYLSVLSLFLYVSFTQISGVQNLHQPLQKSTGITW